MARATLSTGLAGLSGRIGDLVLEQRSGGIVAKPYRVDRSQRTPGQLENEFRLAGLSLAWHALDEASFAAWRTLAEDSPVRNPATGAWTVPNPYNLFCKYAGKVRQVDPRASLEGFRPATSPFGGDGVMVGVSLPLGGETPHGEGSLLLFSADRANANGAVTELLMQPLVNARRRVYRNRDVSQGFVTFEGPGTAAVPCVAGRGPAPTGSCGPPRGRRRRSSSWAW